MITNSEKQNSAEEMLRVALDGFKAGIWTSVPGIVQKYDDNQITVDVQPVYKIPVRDVNGNITQTVMPLLMDCPVMFPRGGGFTLTFPIKKGDECLVVIADRCIDFWWQSGGIQPTRDLRMHDLSDGFAFMGCMSQAKKISGLSTNSTQLRSDDGSTYVEVGNGDISLVAIGKVDIVAPGGFKVDSPTSEATGSFTDMTADGNAQSMGDFREKYNKHNHGGVLVGGARTAADQEQV